MPSVLFITNELYPYDKGGIGRFIYNYCKWNRQQVTPSELHVLYTRRTAFAANWGTTDEADFVLHTMSSLPIKLQEDNIFSGLLDSATFSSLIADSAEIANLVERIHLKIGHGFDYIEFPDFRGLAIDTIRRKKTGVEAFSNSQIVVRLHSAMTLIQIDEGTYHKPSEWFAAVADAERYCLANADLIVGHVQSVIEHNQRAFGFPYEWKQKTVCEFPPVLLSSAERTIACDPEIATEETADVGRVFVFSSRFQVFKRPDLFIDGAICYLDRNPDTSDKFILTSYGWDKSLIQSLRKRIPDRFSGRIILTTDQSHDERIKVLNSGIIVIPSTYESFCIFAYECLLLGRKIVLNEKCKAFGKNQFWQGDTNCKFFDGTAEGMAGALEKINELIPPKRPELPQSKPYWLRELPQLVRSNTKPSIDVILTTPIVSHKDVEATADAFLKCPEVQSMHVLFRDMPKSARKKIKTDSIVFHPTYSDQIDDSTLVNILMTCRSDFVLLTETGTIPSPNWKLRIGAVLSNCASSVLAFPVTEHGVSPSSTHMPMYDCPNLVFSGFGLKIFPIAIARLKLLQLIEGRNETDAAVAQAILDICISGQNVDVIDLPILGRTGATTTNGISSRLLAHCKSRLLRHHLPHLAAFSLDNYQPAALLYATKRSILIKRILVQKVLKKISGFWKK